MKGDYASEWLSVQGAPPDAAFGIIAYAHLGRGWMSYLDVLDHATKYSRFALSPAERCWLCHCFWLSSLSTCARSCLLVVDLLSRYQLLLKEKCHNEKNTKKASFWRQKVVVPVVTECFMLGYGNDNAWKIIIHCDNSRERWLNKCACVAKIAWKASMNTKSSWYARSCFKG